VSLHDRTREDLDKLAGELGIEGAEDLPNKDAVIEKIEALEHDASADDSPANDQDDDGAGDGERRPLVRRPSTKEWKCPFCDSPAGSNESKVTRCPNCGATVDGDEVVAP
jgi:hypothetical protein